MVFFHSHPLLCLRKAGFLTAVGLHEVGMSLGTMEGFVLSEEKSDSHDRPHELDHLMLLVCSCFLANHGHRHSYRYV